MNKDQVEGNWKQMKGLLAQKWGKLTANDFDVARGNRTILAGSLQERYGLAREEAQTQIDEFFRHCRAEQEGKAEIATEGAPLDMKTLKIGM